MGVFNAINISASGMSAERIRMDIISKNIANANTTRTSSGLPYRRKMVVFKEKNSKPFSYYLSNYSHKNLNGQGVKVSAIMEDKTPFKKVYEPGHPDADKDGYVLMPNVEVVKEMVDMISASRAYEANIAAINSSKTMAMKALEIGR
ncbi:flagellar basal body rod protein FlgC [Caloranaerobacter azorensis]|uniref:Flagellar basal-body rod protein FlgC n=2 Tax=Caloranaerobacter azorensis TaxID=116090 RepID=A0A096DNC1_9FIRM|nr:flagellar basal body rod protein FlgC [Caloranaerobacter azorensis]KGG80761.1 flagellar basal body rod protein FlgC [Caloranaerobacter azorensis H53214]QIB26201.1 flagellar basal body rod protein FlgC [Caloranaerobacter azorensis]